jgi:hypothetical protein
MFLDLTLEVSNRIRTQVSDVRLEVRRSTTFINLPPESESCYSPQVLGPETYPRHGVRVSDTFKPRYGFHNQFLIFALVNTILGDCMFMLYGFNNISAIPVEISKTPFLAPLNLLFLWLISDHKAINRYCCKWTQGFVT